MRRLAALVATLLLSALPLASPAPAAPAPPPTGLPDHLGLGLAAGPEALRGWLPASGVPWDYAYQYLTGGANSGSGWSSWNRDASFPLLYARSASAAGQVPVFSYYQLLQTRGPCEGCGEAEQDLATLGDPASMRAYWADLTLLLQRLGPGGFGGTAVVHVEPDLAGYAQQAALDTRRCSGHCTGIGNDPSLVRAAVASSGSPELAGLPDTFAGFTEAVRRLRDRHAPNVLLGYHASGWAALHDIGSNRDPALDPVALGRQVADFAARAGAGRYDLVFNDVADRDAGYVQATQGRDLWWDRHNEALPNFARWERFLGAITASLGLPAVVWQVPIGNQVSRSVDATPGHWSDNRVEYLLAHPEELVDAGVVAVLFGRGDGQGTTYTDDRADGTTNPAPRCTTNGSSRGPICNDRTSTSTDDDGGYLREAAAAYYRAPVPLTARRPAVVLRDPAGACPAGRVVEDGFLDVAAGDPHEASIDCTTWWGVTAGRTTSSFAPGASVSREQVATALVRLLDRSGLPLPATAGDRFPDDDASVHEPAIDRLAAAGLVAGRPDGTFGPGQPVTRAQLASFLARAAEHRLGHPLPAGSDAFSDDDASVHAASIDRLAGVGVAGGVAPGRFRPEAVVTRAQLASFLARLLDLLVDEGATSPPR